MTGTVRGCWVTAVLTLIAAIGVVGCRAKPGAVSSSSPTAEQRSSTEPEWLVDEIARDLAEMCAYAGARSDEGVRAVAVSTRLAPQADGRAFDVTVRLADVPQPIHEQVKLQHSIWSADDYAPLAARLLGARGLRAVPSGRDDGETLLDALREPTAKVLQRLNLDVSDRLATNMLAPENHEAAALILGAFLLREAAREFNDPRGTLCRSAAHLAFARALRGKAPATLSGRFAEATLLTGAENSREALGQLDVLAAQARGSRAQGGWIRALRLRNTHDWRVVERRADLSLLERLEAFRAWIEVLSDTIAVARIDPASAASFAEIPDWGRIALQRDPSVATGHRFASDAIEADLSEADQVWRTWPNHGPVPADWTEALNVPRSRCVARGPRGSLTPEVLSWGTWAAFLQRTLCHQIVATEGFLCCTLGLPDDAKEMALTHDRRFGRLTLYPFVVMWRMRTKRGNEEVAEYFRAGEQALSCVQRSPEVLNFTLFTFLREKYRLRVKAERTTAWFGTGLLPGVGFEGGLRLDNSLPLRTAPIAVADELRSFAPTSHRLVHSWLERKGDSVTVAERRAAYGPLLEYDMQAMRDFAEGVDRQSPAWSDASVETYRRLCALQADSCTSLGYYLATRQREKEAVSAYERAWAKAEDRVLAANNTGWLVRYYLDHGQMRRALDIAKEAGETYSASGLETQAHALERVGRTEQAKAYYERIAERYDSRRELIGFLYRQARLELDERYEPELRRLLAKDFPKGLERLDRAKLPAPPVDGARVLDESVESRLAGLKVGDIIVARDGWRTHNREQYWTIRELAWAEPSTVVVWSEGRYRDVTTTTPDRSFGCSLGAYHGRPAGPPAPPGK